MAALSELRREVKLFANQCPDTTIDYALIRAIRIFCRDSYYYQASLYINQVAATSTYVITPSNNDQVIAIVSVELENDLELLPVSQREASMPDGRVTGYSFEPPNYLTILPQPTTSVTDGIEVRLALMPPEDTTTVPDSVYRNYKETIVNGALGFILALQNEAWSNPSLAMMMNQMFYNGIFKAKGERMKDFKSGDLVTKPRRFAI